MLTGNGLNDWICLCFRVRHVLLYVRCFCPNSFTDLINSQTVFFPYLVTGTNVHFMITFESSVNLANECLKVCF